MSKNKKYKRCDKCNKRFQREELIIGPHGKLCPDCYPIVAEAHSVTFHKLKQKEIKKDQPMVI